MTLLDFTKVGAGFNKFTYRGEPAVVTFIEHTVEKIGVDKETGKVQNRVHFGMAFTYGPENKPIMIVSCFPKLESVPFANFEVDWRK